jgi:hypothetical protein
MPCYLRTKHKSNCFLSQKLQTSLYPLTIAFKLAAKSVAFIDINIVYAKLFKFVKLQNPGVINNKSDIVLDFDLYIKTLDL